MANSNGYDAYTIVFTSPASFWQTHFVQRVKETILVLVLTGIVAMVLYPVFARDHSSRHISCLSNQRQIGLAMQMYGEDYDGVFPGGTRGDHQGTALVKDTPRQARYHAGQGWAGEISPYLKNTQAYRCPDEKRDTKQPQPNRTREAYPVSYAYNRNVAEHNAISGLNAPAVTVLLAEVEGARVHVATLREYAPEERPEERVYSPAGNGLSLVAAADGTQSPGVSAGVRYVTGVLGGYGQTPACSLTHYSVPHASLPRHRSGAVYLLADGHAKYIEPQSVSPGENALRAEDSQDCASRRAAGTRHLDPFRITFSTK